MNILGIVLGAFFICVCICLPFFLRNANGPIVQPDFTKAPFQIGEKFEIEKAITWLREQAMDQGSNTFYFAFVRFETYMTDQEPELFEIEKKLFLTSGTCDFVLMSGYMGLHRWHFLVENFVLKAINEQVESIDVT